MTKARQPASAAQSIPRDCYNRTEPSGACCTPLPGLDTGSYYRANIDATTYR